MTDIKFPLPLFLWVVKKYLWISAVYFSFCTLILFLLAEFSEIVAQSLLFPLIVSLFVFGFIGSAVIFIFVLFYFLKPLALSVRKIESLAKSSSAENPSSHSLADSKEEEEEGDDDSPAEFYNLNKNLNLIYENIQKKSLNLAIEEAELKAVTSAVSDAIIAVDLKQTIIFSNSQSEKLFLFDGAGEKPSTLSEIAHSDEILKACEKCLKYATASKLEQTLTVGEYQQDRLFDISVSPLTYTKGQVDGAVIVFYDKTEIKNTEKSHSDFVSNVSHELKTPLTVIKGFVETMTADLEQKNFDQLHHFLNIVNRNVKRLIALIDDLLSLSHIDSESTLKKEEINTKEATALVCETIKTDHHKVNYIFKAETVLASKRWLEQVLHNLVSNAVKYTPKGSTIDIIWEKHPHFILLTVKDNGEGIPLQHQNRIFERFYRVDDDRSRAKGGTGIGLALVKQIMEKHGGKVYLTSRRRGKGAKLTCTFPR